VLEDHGPEANAEIEALLSSIFGNSRQQEGQEKTQHLGVVFKDVVVKGQGLGAALQPTNGDFFLGPWRAIRGLFPGGEKVRSNGDAVRTLIHGFSGCVRPGEMCLVLGRPGSGELCFMVRLLAGSAANWCGRLLDVFESYWEPEERVCRG